MDEQLHIIITGDRGKIFRLPCTRSRFRFFVTALTAVILFLLITSSYSISLFKENRNRATQLTALREQLNHSRETIAEHERISKGQKLALNLEVANLELNNLKQANAFKEEKEHLMSTAVSELNERSELIEKVMDSIGIDLGKEENGEGKNSGGPFIPQPESDQDELLYRADQYLETIHCIPLGKPSNGVTTSRFGKRKDPFNKRKALHTGIDFRGKRGDKVYATADGTVIKAFNNGGYGKYISINHGNGYITNFAHLEAYLVKKGEQVKRGQLIGLVGNTGRSTGPHLHYEVYLNKKPINPYKFLKVASLLESNSASPEKK